jgi:DNA-binding NarL/FixJ family response regulator
MQNSKPVLLVEDDNIDAMTVKRAFEDLNIKNPLVHKESGEEALAYLWTKEGKETSVMLLDLNMPKMNGVEFLKIVKGDDELKRIPVVAMTISQKHQDVIESFNLGVAGYMLKDADYKGFVETIRTIILYWTLLRSITRSDDEPFLFGRQPSNRHIKQHPGVRLRRITGKKGISSIKKPVFRNHYRQLHTSQNGFA